MIALINNVVAGAGVTLLINYLLGGNRVVVPLICGVTTAVVLTILFLAYERWRFASDPIVRTANASG